MLVSIQSAIVKDSNVKVRCIFPTTISYWGGSHRRKRTHSSRCVCRTRTFAGTSAARPRSGAHYPSLTADPAHSQSVTWRTEKAITSRKPKSRRRPQIQTLRRRQQAQLQRPLRSRLRGKTAGEYAAHFEGLGPNTRYTTASAMAQTGASGTHSAPPAISRKHSGSSTLAMSRTT